MKKPKSHHEECSISISEDLLAGEASMARRDTHCVRYPFTEVANASL